MATYDTLPQGIKAEPKRHKIAVAEERLQELKQLLRFSRVGPPTYENLHADPVHCKLGQYGISRDWLINAKKEWETFDWRAVEDELNSFPNYTHTVEDLDVHFLALFSTKPDAIPVLLLHGWPGSILEFVPLLSLFRQQYSPQELPFHLIVPSLPGYAFSGGPPLDRDFKIADAARLLNTLMLDLGFGETGYVVQGGDIGSRVARLLGSGYDACKAVHLNFCLMPQPPNTSVDTLDEDERRGWERGTRFMTVENAYAREHATRPATIGLILGSSPLALLSWIGEKFYEGTDESPPLKEILASVSLYWLTDSGARCIYPYRDSYGSEPTHHGTPRLYINKPFGYSYYPWEAVPVPISWAAKTGNLVWSKRHTKGGHFAAWERPEAMKEDIESFVAQVWKKAA